MHIDDEHGAEYREQTNPCTFESAPGARRAELESEGSRRWERSSSYLLVYSGSNSLGSRYTTKEPEYESFVLKGWKSSFGAGWGLWCGVILA
jgi:hypothetical protein